MTKRRGGIHSQRLNANPKHENSRKAKKKGNERENPHLKRNREREKSSLEKHRLLFIQWILAEETKEIKSALREERKEKKNVSNS